MSNSQPVLTIYDLPMWDSIARQALALQKCAGCGRYRYPPGPSCPYCLSMEAAWTPLAGQGRIISWVVFHRKYFDDYPPPYNVVAVELAEGPILVSNLVGREPEGSWIGSDVELCYEEHRGRWLHRVRLPETV